VIPFFGFEGRSNPDDDCSSYAIETSSWDKGLLADAYGAHSYNVPKEIIDKVRIVR
tara:strand:+ start:2787 stop:2954 length:168 start_codon:yes stop_codon:yes gene_type:complete